jgi:peptidoglycan/xylan/chitin deacetylase (PgdA/CDA1 family)
MKPRLLLLLVVGLLVLIATTAWYIEQRLATCRPVPLFADELLPNAQLEATDAGQLPDGWSVAAPGAQLRRPKLEREGFDLDGDDRAFQLIGIGNFIETPAINARPGTTYCFTTRALTDSPKQSATRLQLTFRWFDAAGQLLNEVQSDWQPVVLWSIDFPPSEWSLVTASAIAPTNATQLRVRVQPASDDRIYLDRFHAQVASPFRRPTAAPISSAQPPLPQIEPWPDGARAAVSFSFDWETAMGGLIHSRSVDDPNSDQDPTLRALRMREGVTTTLAIFEPYGVRATYFANGYNFLLGNAERRTFLGDPTYTWANATNRWPNDNWKTTRWFAPDPYGTVASHPAWYFGDLVPRLRAANQSIQSHTFSHMHVGLASHAELQLDIAAWNQLASERQTPPARVLAFPWSGSNGMSDLGWQILAEQGFFAVTRTAWRQRQFQLVDEQNPQCTPVPGQPRLLACPDFLLVPARAGQAKMVIDRAIEVGGMIDLWAHTEEVTSADQIAAWRDVVSYAAQRRDAGEVWIAPLAEIAARQHAVAQVVITPATPANGFEQWTLTNRGEQNLDAVTVTLPFAATEVLVDGQPLAADARRETQVILDLPAGAQRVLALKR